MNLQLSTSEMAHQPAERSVQEDRAPAAPATPARSWLMIAAVVVCVIALGAAGWYFHEPLFAMFEAPPLKIAPPPPESVTVNQSGLVCVAEGCTLEKRLRIVPVVRETFDYPLLNVTGYVMSRIIFASSV